MTITLLDTGTLMIHRQTNVYDYFTFQHFAQSPPLLKQIWDANKESLSDFIYLSNSQEKKKVKLSPNMLLNAILCSGTVLNTAMDIY